MCVLRLKSPSVNNPASESVFTQMFVQCLVATSAPIQISSSTISEVILSMDLIYIMLFLSELMFEISNPFLIGNICCVKNSLITKVCIELGRNFTCTEERYWQHPLHPLLSAVRGAVLAAPSPSVLVSSFVCLINSCYSCNH